MVNAEKVKRKIPSVFVDNCSKSNRKEWNKFMRVRYRFLQWKKNHPEQAATLLNKLVADYKEIEQAVNSA